MIAWLRAKPVFVDIHPETYNIRTDQVASRITGKTRAIIAVHLFGQCCRMEELSGLQIPIIEDACQAIGATRNGAQAGSMGATGCFSFFPTKNLGGYGDGGLITTSNENTAECLKQLRSHGSSSQYFHDRIGTNSRLDELQAAVLRAKFKHLVEWNRKRNQNANHYFEHLKGLPIHLPEVDEGNVSTFHQFVIRMQNRDRLKTYLAEQGIGTAIYYPLPLHLQPCFSNLGNKRGDLPGAEECAETSIALPIYPELTREQLEFVCVSIRKFFE
jgi:dTDP-4-amino-4,6-dideoxygalactose transaminase